MPGEHKCYICGSNIAEDDEYIIERGQLRAMVVCTNDRPICSACSKDYLSMLSSVFGEDILLDVPINRTGHELTPDQKEHFCNHCNKPLKWDCYVMSIRDSHNKILTKTIYRCSECSDIFHEKIREIREKRNSEK